MDVGLDAILKGFKNGRWLRAPTREEVAAEPEGPNDGQRPLPKDLVERAIDYACSRYDERDLKNISMEEVLNPGGIGGGKAPLNGYWTQNPDMIEVKRMVSAGEISLDFHVMPDCAPYDLHRFSGGSEEHKAYCSSAAWWIDRSWDLRGPSKIEEWFLVERSHKLKAPWSRKWASDAEVLAFANYPAGGRSDLVAVDRSLYVECGFLTSPSKILNAIDSKSFVLVVPYRHTVKLNRAVGFLFGPASR